MQITIAFSYPVETTNVINQLFQSPEAPTTNKRWYPTPETCEDLALLNNIGRRIYDEILKLRELEKLDPKVDDDQRRAFLDQFNWENLQFNPEEQAMVDWLLVKYHRIFARHQFNIGITNDLKIKLTAQQVERVNGQSLRTPMNLIDETSVEPALHQKYGIITTLFFSNKSRPIFAQQKPNGKLGTLMGLQRINHPVSTTTTNTTTQSQELPMLQGIWLGKKFCKPDFSQAYHFLQTADEPSVQFLLLNFGARTIVY